MTIPDGTLHLSRRSVLKSGAAATALAAAGLPATAQEVLLPAGSTAAAPALPLRLTINGRERAVSLDARTTLLDALRYHLALSGSKKGCDHGQCGACTVLVNGRRINACLTLAVMHEGDEIITVEGLAEGEQLHPLQAAFVARFPNRHSSPSMFLRRYDLNLSNMFYKRAILSALASGSAGAGSISQGRLAW